MEPRRPPPLQPGDTIHLCAPSYPAEHGKIEAAVRLIQSAGFKTDVAENACSSHGYLAGDDDSRAKAMNHALADPKIRAIMAVRGGYGALRILHRLDLYRLADDPKILIGYSDFTAILLAAYRQANLMGFHGLLAAVDIAGPHGKTAFQHLLQATSSRPLGDLPAPQILRSGRGQGPLLGGCLSLLSRLVGTEFMPDLTGAILFWEDVGEEPYQIDRMLTHLRLAGHLEELGGMVIGALTDCVPDRPKPTLTIPEAVLECLRGTDYPILMGLRTGHLPNPLTIPMGVMARIETGGSRGRLTVEEAATGGGRMAGDGSGTQHKK